MHLFLRAYADCGSSEAARDLAARLGLALSHLSPQASLEPRRYWKLPHLYEFAFHLSPATEAAFQSLVSASSGGWSHSNLGADLSSVWSRRQDHVFLVPEVSWAEVQLYETAP